MNEKPTRRPQQPPHEATRDSERVGIGPVDRRIGEQAATVFYKKVTQRADVRRLLEKLAA